MADPILHIKDCYYFEVPKFLARSNRHGKHFPEFWVRLDDQFQEWEAHRLHEKMVEIDAERAGSAPALTRSMPPLADLEHSFHEWQHHDHANHGKPFDVYLEEHAALVINDFKEWQAAEGRKTESFQTFLAQGAVKHDEHSWIAERLTDPKWSAQWKDAKEFAGGEKAVEAFIADDSIKWSPKKIEGYNNALSGKILIPQPFATQKNLYEVESGVGISKFMILEAFVAVVIVAVFSWLATRFNSSDRPKGKLWNTLEAVLLFIRDQVARPAIDSHDHHDEGHGHGEHGHTPHKPAHGEPAHEGDKYVPFLWTLFLFILGCNLVGMFPWAGAPGASFAITLSLAAMTFLVGFVSGIRKFGFLGYWKNQVPSMDLPLYMAIPLLPVIFVIEVLGLFIKHGVLGIRLLANIAAGHLVLVSLLGLTFSVAAASNEQLNIIWPFASIVVVLGSAALSCLELFVAFLQAYVFTLLSALFIGAAVHKH